ncbi:C39 family peptidase [Patescibacteria group bacterium]|nr:C39 family peptidase [Patescibacteria group bacterium]
MQETKTNKKFIKTATALLLFLFLVGGGYLLYINLKPKPSLEQKFVVEERNLTSTTSPFGKILNHDEEQPMVNAEEIPKELAPTHESTTFSVPEKYEIPQASHTYQTFNNCGPATLSMILSYYDINVNQKELGDLMRPYQHPKGDNDDKTIFPSEFMEWAQVYGEEKNLKVIYRPNGSIELLKLFISNDIPVVVKMWLNTKEDIGHFVLARGYDETKQIILKDDSYYGPNKKVEYFDFMSMWQSFNYSYIVLYTPEQESVIKSILGPEINEYTAWENAVVKAHKEHDLDPENIYPFFNLSVGYYHIGEYENSIKYFEQVEKRLPRRMLWYQIEPIKAYQKTGSYDKVFQIIEHILNDNNLAFSELYYIRGEIYLEQNNTAAAKTEFETALKYNKNYIPAKEILEKLE